MPRAFLPLLDPLRILASVAVVRHHMRTDFLFGVGFGLPLFLVIMFALASSSTKEEALGSFARRKTAWLLVPWLRWSAIYLVIFAFSDAARGLDPFERVGPAMIWTGGDPKLWFLPFAAVALVAVKALQSVMRRIPVSTAVIASAVLAVAATNAVAWSLTHSLPEMPTRAWLRVAPTLFFGLALGQSLRAADDGERRRLLAVVVLLAFLSFWLSPFRDHHEDLPRRFAAAVPLAALGFGWRPRVPGFVRSVASVTFGVYLVHPLVAKVLVAGADVQAWPAAVHAGAVWVLSALVVLGLRHALASWHECAAPGRLAPAAGLSS